MVKVIYERESGRVFATEEDGVWTLPLEYDVIALNADEEAFVDDDGDIYLKSTSMPERRAS